MAYVCDNCGKASQYGETHSHRRGVAGGRWKKRAAHTRKVFKPNLHKWMGMKLCTKCLRKLKALRAKREEVKETKVVAAA